MKRKLFLLTAIIIAISLANIACKQSNVSEDTAKENALNYLNKTFDTTLTRADIMLLQHQEIAFENDQIVQKDHEPPIEYYSVSVSDENGATQYNAEVDAKTGAVTYVYHNSDLVELTEEQKTQADAIGTYADYSADRFRQEQKDAAQVAVQWVQEKMEPDGEVHHATAKDIYTDQEMFPELVFDSIVVMKSGTAYHVLVIWPAMDVVEAYIFQQES